MAERSREEALKRWVEERTGQPVSRWTPVPGGASRLSYAAETADGGRYFLRVDSGSGGLSGTRYDLEREQDIIAALHRQGFPVPAIHGWSPALQAILMEHVSGTTGPQGLDRTALQRALLESVAQLQRLPVDFTMFPYLADHSIAAALRAELELWGGLYRQRATQPEPVIALALRWLASDIPDAEAPAVWVHGDIGPGNFLFSEDRITALIDWELAHPGHPLEDLACIIARGLGAPFGDNRTHLKTFEQYRGQPVDRSALDYCLVLVLTRFCIGIQMALSKPSVSLDVPMLVRFRQLNLQALMGLLAAHHGVELRPLPMQPVAAGELGALFGTLSDTLEQLIAPALAGQAFLSHRLEGLCAINRYLEAIALYGYDRYSRDECERIQELLGSPQSELPNARRMLCDAIPDFGPAETEACVHYLAWRSQREHQLMAGALGDMGMRRLDY